MSQSGLAHFAEHMTFAGTTTRTADQISIEEADIAGSFNAFTTHESVFFEATVIATMAERSLSLLSDMILRSASNPLDIERERAVIAQEIASDQGDPYSRVFELYMRTQWPHCTLGLPITGTLESIGSFTSDILSNYAATNFTSKKIVVAGVGDLQHESYVSMVERHFSEIRLGLCLDSTSAARPSAGIAFDRMPIDQVHFVMGFPAPAISDPRYYPVHMLSSLLGD
jgi:predicted Zn-dependent peptidase